MNKYSNTNNQGQPDSQKKSKKMTVPFMQICITTHEWLVHNVSNSALCTYYTLRSFSNAQLKPAFPSQQKLSERLNKSISAVWRAVKELEKAGAIKIIKNNNRNTYEFVLEKNHSGIYDMNDFKKTTETKIDTKIEKQSQSADLNYAKMTSRKIEKQPEKTNSAHTDSENDYAKMHNENPISSNIIDNDENERLRAIDESERQNKKIIVPEPKQTGEIISRFDSNNEQLCKNEQPTMQNCTVELCKNEQSDSEKNRSNVALTDADEMTGRLASIFKLTICDELEYSHYVKKIKSGHEKHQTSVGDGYSKPQLTPADISKYGIAGSVKHHAYQHVSKYVGDIRALRESFDKLSYQRIYSIIYECKYLKSINQLRNDNDTKIWLADKFLKKCELDFSTALHKSREKFEYLISKYTHAEQDFLYRQLKRFKKSLIDLSFENECEIILNYYHDQYRNETQYLRIISIIVEMIKNQNTLPLNPFTELKNQQKIKQFRFVEKFDDRNQIQQTNS